MPPESYTKVLSPTDAGESQTHQSGILIPVSDGERLFPAPLGRESVDSFQCVDHTGKTWTFNFRHRVKSSESRITRTTSYVKRYALRSGDSVTMRAPHATGGPYRIEFEPTGGARLAGEENIPADSGGTLPEGAVRSIRVNHHERNPRNRARAIERHGVRCFGCDREMAELYGAFAAGYIHIHHTKPISQSGGPTVPNIDDLIPLCPNCHAVVHLEDPPLTINRLKELIAAQQSGQ